MTHRYYGNSIPNIDYDVIARDLRREGVSEHEMMFAMERRAQTMLRVLLARETALCDIDHNPCSHQYCSTCPRNE